MDLREATTDERALVAEVRRIVRAVELDSQRLVAASGLTSAQLTVLRHLEVQGASTPTQLAHTLWVKQPTVTGILERLQERGLVRAQPVEGDRRKRAFALTDEGRTKVAAAPPLLHDRLRERVRALEPWERMQLLAALKRLAALLGASDLEASAILTPGAAAAGTDVRDQPNTHGEENPQ
jgi:DNA-binding MarR family transcriptional regulator